MLCSMTLWVPVGTKLRAGEGRPVPVTSGQAYLLFWPLAAGVGSSRLWSPSVGQSLRTVLSRQLKEAIELELKEMGLQVTPFTMTKVIQLYETKNSRHSTMIVGNTGSGKTVTWRTLQATMSTLCRNGDTTYNLVRDFPLNPKAVSLGELYGEYDLSTNEWTDGILSSVMRTACADEKPDEKWILFDGPVDTLWIESMNSVMDDNKVLTLINGERISMPDQVSLLFEVENLAVASPATVSRCGMVYTDYSNLGWKPYVHSWIEKRPKVLGSAEGMGHRLSKRCSPGRQCSIRGAVLQGAGPRAFPGQSILAPV
nr:dynein heavy chain 2, axonemal-like [Pelodiscus sinensis]|eukprot:XP_014435496.1 dynein heavy chain 2, axonemal-like [Pelodiscus sinensis]